jgi:carbonic anhydrase
MQPLSNLLENNRAWAAQAVQEDKDFFARLTHQQAPKYLWVGCADSRVPANQITGLAPGELFVHRNVANLVVHTDLNCLSVLQYAVEVLKVEHVIVCGHYGCGGVVAAMNGNALGLIDNWLRNIKDVFLAHREELEAIADLKVRGDRLCELNVAAQVANLCRTTFVQDAWVRGQPLSVHGWVYGVNDGLVKDLKISLSSTEDVPAIYRLGVPRQGDSR